MYPPYWVSSKEGTFHIGGNTFFEVERAMGIEPTSSAWKADILADVRCPRMQDELYHVLAQMSSANF